MARYQVILAYDGSQYQGFQRQPRADTVQATVEAALSKLGWKGAAILAAGRTDTGVHATGQVIAFDLDWQHTAGDLQAALNANLPSDISVVKVQPVSSDFHPRYAATARCYHYHLFCQEIRDPLRERFAWRVWPGVSLEKLAPVAEILVGRHDFSAFGTPPRAGGSTIRTVFATTWKPVDAHWENPDLVFEITADAFLFRMVRRLVAIQVAVGQGRLELADISRWLETPPAFPVQGLAPPNGLFLHKVIFGNNNELQ
jgi:tRNA pseudouridine38-40 synthase